MWGQQIKVYSDQNNLMQDACGLSSDQVMRWILLLKEQGPKIIYIKGINDTVADAISRLEHDHRLNASKDYQFKFVMFNQLASYISPIPCSTEDSDHLDYKSVFINMKELDYEI